MLAKEEEHAVRRVKREKRRFKIKTKSKQFLNKVIAAIPRSKNNINELDKNKNELNSTKDEMKNYLISHILFDEGEGVQSLNKEAIKSQELQKKDCQDKELE